jgi:hypothetical protein
MDSVRENIKLSPRNSYEEIKNKSSQPLISTALTIVEMKALLRILIEVSHCTIFSEKTVTPSLMRFTIRAYDVASTATESPV